MSCFAIVIANDVGLAFSRRASLGGVDVYSASVRSIRGATVLTTLLSIVSLIGLGCSVLSFALLLTRVLPIVDLDCYSDVVIKTVGPIDLV